MSGCFDISDYRFSCESDNECLEGYYCSGECRPIGEQGEGDLEEMGDLDAGGDPDGGGLGGGLDGDSGSEEIHYKEWRMVAGGMQHSCGIADEGTLWCWGSNYFHQLGREDPVYHQALPVQVGRSDQWRSVSAGGGHSCGIRLDDTLWCWGRNNAGQLGIASQAPHSKVPVKVDGEWKSVSLGGEHSCGIRLDDTLLCWGKNSSSELGDGTITQRSDPVIVGTGAWNRDAQCSRGPLCAAE